MNNREDLLDIIGAKGKAREACFFANAEMETHERGKAVALMKANEFVKYRREHIELTRQGEFEKYGITADDIVE